jgi:alkylation response protein AidB-like acyl-CoA dehydrogenase
MVAAEPDRSASYLEAVRKLAPLIAERRAAFDRERRLTDDVFEALADAGLFRLWLPSSLGGGQLSPLEFMRVVEAAAALDGSVGWLVGNGGGMSRVGGYLPTSVARDWFANRRTFIASATGAVGAAQAVDGGYRVSGRWPFGSGAPHATHFMGLATVGGDLAPEQQRLCCYFDRRQVTIHDTWHVSGLRGTGSSDFEVREAFVPKHHVHPFVGHVPVHPGLLYRMPPLSVFAWTVSVVPLGQVRGAIDAFVALASARSRLGSSGLLRDRDNVQGMLGRVEALHSAARAFLIEAMTELMMDAAGTLQLPVRPRTTMAELVAKENDAGAELNQEEPVDPKLRHCSAHIDRKRSEALFGHQHAPAIMPGTGVVREIFARAIQRERMQVSVRALENEHIEICHGHHSRKGETARVGARLAQLASALREIGQPKHTARRCSTPSLSKLWDRLDERHTYGAPGGPVVGQNKLQQRNVKSPITEATRF